MTASRLHLTVRGLHVSTVSPRRYIVVAVRPEPVTTPEGTYVAFARIEKRSDSLVTAHTAARRLSSSLRTALGVAVVVVDRETGLEVDSSGRPTYPPALPVGSAVVAGRDDLPGIVADVRFGSPGHVAVLHPGSSVPTAYEARSVRLADDATAEDDATTEATEAAAAQAIVADRRALVVLYVDRLRTGGHGRRERLNVEINRLARRIAEATGRTPYAIEEETWRTIRTYETPEDARHANETTPETGEASPGERLPTHARPATCEVGCGRPVAGWTGSTDASEAIYRCEACAVETAGSWHPDVAPATLSEPLGLSSAEIAAAGPSDALRDALDASGGWTHPGGAEYVAEIRAAAEAAVAEAEAERGPTVGEAIAYGDGGRSIVETREAYASPIVPGATVESFRFGAGQPRISGVVDRVADGLAYVVLPDGSTRARSLRNLRVVEAAAEEVAIAALAGPLVGLEVRYAGLAAVIDRVTPDGDETVITIRLREPGATLDAGDYLDVRAERLTVDDDAAYPNEYEVDGDGRLVRGPRRGEVRLDLSSLSVGDRVADLYSPGRVGTVVWIGSAFDESRGPRGADVPTAGVRWDGESARLRYERDGAAGYTTTTLLKLDDDGDDDGDGGSPEPTEPTDDAAARYEATERALTTLLGPPGTVTRIDLPEIAEDRDAIAEDDINALDAADLREQLAALYAAGRDGSREADRLAEAIAGLTGLDRIEIRVNAEEDAAALASPEPEPTATEAERVELLHALDAALSASKPVLYLTPGGADVEAEIVTRGPGGDSYRIRWEDRRGTTHDEWVVAAALVPVRAAEEPTTITLTNLDTGYTVVETLDADEYREPTPEDLAADLDDLRRYEAERDVAERLAWLAVRGYAGARADLAALGEAEEEERAADPDVWRSLEGTPEDGPASPGPTVAARALRDAEHRLTDERLNDALGRLGRDAGPNRYLDEDAIAEAAAAAGGVSLLYAGDRAEKLGLVAPEPRTGYPALSDRSRRLSARMRRGEAVGDALAIALRDALSPTGPRVDPGIVSQLVADRVRLSGLPADRVRSIAIDAADRLADDPTSPAA